jgi:hypothetical protein
MLKDLSGQSEEPELALECRGNEQPNETERWAQFRTSLWLGIAADIRRERTSRAMKGQVSC